MSNKDTCIFQESFEHTPAQAAIIDSDGTVVQANEDWLNFEKTKALENADIGANYIELCEKQEHSKIKNQLQKLFNETEEKIILEYEYDHGKNGRKEWYSIRAQKFKHQNKQYVVIAHWDITERRRTKQNLKNFGSILRHDIRNHISIAEGYLGFIETEQTDKLKQVKTAISDIERTVDSTLTLTGQHKYTEKRELSLKRVAQDAWKTIQNPNNATLDVHDRTLKGDNDLIQQLLENIFKNSIQHNQKENLQITTSPTKNGFKIRDNGSGTDMKNPHHLFRYGNTKSDNNGDGLGLAIARRVAETHDWEIQITETQNAFEITLTTDPT
jgi:PAS domain S-box-containing protein